MSRAKAFWLGLGCTLAVLLPIYLAVAAVIFTRSAPADTVQSGVPIAQPTLGDEKNFLLMTGPEQPETFVLLRFDALEGNLCSVAIPGETVVLVNGQPATLADAAEQAGPAQAAAALMETLDIEIDNYLYCTADRLVDLAAGFGTARIPLANYMTPEALGQLQLNIPGVQTVSLTPQMLADVLAAGAATPDMQALLRAEGYLAFLRIGGDALADTVPDAVRAVLAQSSTNLTATQIFDYERIFGFLRKEPPQYRAGVLPGTWADGRYELAENSVTVAAAYFKRASSYSAWSGDGVSAAPDSVPQARLETQTDSPSLRLRQAAGQAPAARRRAPARKKQRAFRRTAERGRKMTPRDPLRPGRLAAQKLPVL